MQYNFDEIIERRGTDSVKWDGVQKVWGQNKITAKVRNIFAFK